MGRIQVLPDPLIDRIAAGEVVERPSSVVKELVENSIDSRARSVSVELRGGGKQLIRVDDDGCGMDAADAVLAVQRHATSKVRSGDDLEAIATLGFRGEALSSIAAVSHFTLRTATANGEGTEIEVRGGEVVDVRQSGLPVGTSIGVERLFYNVPARRKFLRTDSTELSHAVRWVTRYALAFPQIAFSLTHAGRRLVDAPRSGDLSERIGQIYGRELAAKLLRVACAEGDITVSGFAGRPVDALPRRDGQHLFVNGRAVQDRVLAHAVSQAYGNTMPAGRYPALFLGISMAASAVDVNVHPQKTEVRFRDSSRVHDLVRRALATSLSEQGAVPRLTDLRPAALGPGPDGARRATLEYLETREPRPDRGAFHESSAPSTPRGATPVAAGESTLVEAIHAAETEHPTRQARFLAQYRDSYIVAQDREGLVLVDQHAAHERVLFERYLDQAEENCVEVQRLMFPSTFELPPHEQVLLEEELEEFRRLGFRLEPFGGSSVRVDGVPALAGDVRPESLLRELLGEASRARAAAADVGRLRHRLVTSAACQAAIKINRPMAPPEMQGLLDDLYATVNPTTCPHGRPAVFRLTLDEIERAFHRK